MNTYVNYLLEANLGLCLFLLVYYLLLRNETNFTFKRFYLLAAIVASVLFPLITIQQKASPIPSLHYSIIEPVEIPENISALPATETRVSITIWQIMLYIYGIGAIITLLIFIYRVYGMLRIIQQSKRTHHHHFTIIELPGTQSPFSFFRFIFIGSDSELNEQEKQQIVSHEQIHTGLFHSIDIILINLLGIVFWFNPIVAMYKKTFVQLHEFEADARAVEIHNVDEYCNLLARVALQAADFRLANHFNNSLILKRIEMMRTFKQKMKHWKIAAVVVVLPIFFVVVACQDQVLDEVKEITANSNMTLDYPKEVHAKVDELKSKNPGFKYIIIEPTNETTGLKAENLKKEMSSIDQRSVNYIEVMRDILDESGFKRSFVIIQYNDKISEYLEIAQSQGSVYTAVEQGAEPVGGIANLKKFIAANYDPSIPGKTYVQFTVHEDGSLSDFTVTRGVSAEADQEALRVAALFPKWNPGKQNGKPVKSRYILPIGNDALKEIAVENSQRDLSSLKPDNSSLPLEVTYSTKKQGNELIISGAVKTSDDMPLAGATVLIYKGVTGTSTDSEGNFTLRVPAQTEKIVVSFIGFETKIVQL